MSDDYERKLEVVAEAIYDSDGGRDWEYDPDREQYLSNARAVLDALRIHPPKPKWPTQEMIERAGVRFYDGWGMGVHHDRTEAALKAAYEVDPRRKIVEAAVAMRDRFVGHEDAALMEERDVIAAVKEAEL